MYILGEVEQWIAISNSVPIHSITVIKRNKMMMMMMIRIPETKIHIKIIHTKLFHASHIHQNCVTNEICLISISLSYSYWFHLFLWKYKKLQTYIVCVPTNQRGLHPLSRRCRSSVLWKFILYIYSSWNQVIQVYILKRKDVMREILKNLVKLDFYFL